MPGVISGPSGTPLPPSAPPGFELLGPLGTGAASAVWAARSVATGATVALKWLAIRDEQRSARLRAEAEVLASLDHPNIVRVLDLVGGPAGELVLVLEHAPGGSLADAITRHGRLGAEEVGRIGSALADALAAAHSRGVLHRDVKPTNILFTAEGAPLLADFGSATASPRPRVAHEVVGTAEYLDPAVARGGAPEPRSDVYGLGIALYEALAGHVPFTGATPEDVLAAAGDGRHITLDLAAPEAPDDLVTAIERAFARDPRDRQRDAAALADELSREPAPGVAVGGLPWDPPTSRPAPVTLGEASSLLPLERPGQVPHRPTATFGPRPPRPTSPVQVLRRAALLAPLAALVITGAVLASPLSPLAGQDEDGPAVPPTTAACTAIERGPGFVAADLDGDGCPTALRWDGEVLEVPEDTTIAAARYAIGRPGDTLVFGDWDCDGLVTPAIHRPEVGQTVIFDEWANAGQPLEGRTAEVEPGGTATVEAGDDGCDELRIER